MAMRRNEVFMLMREKHEVAKSAYNKSRKPYDLGYMTALKDAMDMFEMMNKRCTRPGYYVCAKCGEEKKREQFNRADRQGNGIQPYCKNCERKKRREYYINHKEDEHRKEAERRRKKRSKAYKLSEDEISGIHIVK